MRFSAAAGPVRRQGRLHAHRRSRKGMLGANSIVGGRRSADPRRGADGEALKTAAWRWFVGDGGSNREPYSKLQPRQGVELPAIFVVEDNGYAEENNARLLVGGSRASAARWGCRRWTVDGSDFFAVYEVAAEAIARARSGGGPSIIDWPVTAYGHFEGDPTNYRGKGEVAATGPRRTG